MRKANGTIHVFTFKDGLLSAVAHDLRLALERFIITLEDETVRCELDLTSLVLDGPVEDGVLHPERCDEQMRTEVEETVRSRILRTSEFPNARFVGRAVDDGHGFQVSGGLELAGRTAPLSFEVRNDAGTYRASIDLQLTHWGIAPYRAMFGAIRLKDRVRVELALVEA